MIYDVPFTPNSKDDLHCVQASYLSIIKYFKPELNIPMYKLSKLSGFELGKGTWASKGLLWLNSHGFEVKDYELFDYEAFIKYGGDYLIALNGKSVGEWQIAHSNIPLEQKRAKKLIDSKIFERREPTIEDIMRFLNNGYLLRVSINAKKLNHEKGYFGHSVTVVGYDKLNIIFHDPGLPPIPYRKVTISEFEAAWSDPNKEHKELDAVRLKKV